jgi:CheY-like chemotaxis protein
MNASLVILLAEDNALIAEPLELRFERLGQTVLSAADGLSAIDLAVRYRPDLAIVDLRLPGMDGLTVVRRLKDDQELADMPAITMSAGDRNLDEPAAMAAGARSHLQKPFKFAELLRLVEGLSGSARHRAEAR